MRREQVLRLLEEEMLQEEKNVVLSTKRINIGRLSGKIAPRDPRPIRVS